jgi:hypothetical protein
MTSHEVGARIRFRGLRVQVRYSDVEHEAYGRLWNFASRKLDGVFLTDAEHNCICRQIRCHSEARKGRHTVKQSCPKTL